MSICSNEICECCGVKTSTIRTNTNLRDICLDCWGMCFPEYNGSCRRTKCNHDALGFGSGAYYLICQDCQQYWVAVVPGTDNADHSHGGNNPKGGLRIMERPSDLNV